MSPLFEEFLAYYNEMKMIGLAANRIGWDMETCTPKKGIPSHIEALTYFRTKSFRMSVDEKFGRMLEALNRPEEYDKLSEPWQFTVKKLKKEYDSFAKLPAALYQKIVHDRAESNRAWQEAKRTNNFALFAPYLAREFENAKEKAAVLAPGKDVYDFLINEAEPGMNCETIDRVFSELKAGLKELLPEILKRQPKESLLAGRSYDTDHERKACRFLVGYIGFDFDAGNLSEVEHPLTGGSSRNDVRVSNHYYENDAMGPLFTILHEGGHGLFNQGVDEKYEGTEAEHIHSAGLHESQSRFMENIVGRNASFWKPVYPKLCELLPEIADLTLDEFVSEANRVKPGTHRMTADEVTYCFHIILRHELEKQIFRGEVDVNDLPRLWNDKTEELLGVRPGSDTEGILQDLHWASGYLGYFPSYLLGSIYDGMLLEAMEAELGPIETLLEQGEVLKIREWLREKIHRFGGTRTSLETIEAVCHKPLSAEPLLKYFRRKYLGQS